MEHYYLNDLYMGWGWFLWLGLILVLFSSMGNWGYTYVAHRRYSDGTRKDALDILSERYARGDLTQQDFFRMRSEIRKDRKEFSVESAYEKGSPA